jgi:chemotaxis signal transduction protein
MELIIVERDGVRLGVPAHRVAAVADLPHGERDARLQQRLGQPPLTDDERCFGLRVEVPGGEIVVAVAGRVSIATVPTADIASLPALLAGAAPVAAVVFAGDASVLVLDVDAMVAHTRAVQ